MKESAGPTIRIIAGRWKGRRLFVPETARPTSARAREALFSILQRRIAGARVLDLYAGSGAVGLEAVSRGAASATLVERDRQTLRRNLQRLPPPHDGIEIAEEEAEGAVHELARIGRKFDLVFADPPYGRMPAVFASRAAALLATGGLVIFQSDRFHEEIPRLSGLHLVERRAYGRNVFLFYASDPAARPARPSGL